MSAAVTRTRRASGRRWTVAWAVAGLWAVAGCSGDDSVGDDAPTTVDVAGSPSSGPVGGGVRPVGFTTIVAEVTSADGEVCAVCLWLADTSDERSQGLTGVTDLGEPVGMVFRWEEPVESRFVMIDTPTPLSIAWFDAEGAFASQTDMEPCVDTDPSSCARYSAGVEYALAVEMFAGELDGVGIGPGSSIELLAGTESPDCQTAG
jgi:uncharacterized membrane protein (UPF0127 family)